MAIRLPEFIPNTKRMLRKASACPPEYASTKGGVKVPKGYVPVYVGESGEERRRFIVPLACLKHPDFQKLLRLAEEEFGFEHPMGCLTIPCSKENFVEILSRIE